MNLRRKTGWGLHKQACTHAEDSIRTHTVRRMPHPTRDTIGKTCQQVRVFHSDLNQVLEGPTSERYKNKLPEWKQLQILHDLPFTDV